MTPSVGEMALPALDSLQSCADFSLTVTPYLPQLYALPAQILGRLNDFNGLKELYLATNPVITSLALALWLAPVVLIVSEINKNYSQVDRLWSIVPVIYNIHYAVWAHMWDLPARRLDHVMAVTILWGIRLTFNYWRKGGYSVGSEDYRWEVLRKYLSPAQMFLFNVTFISFAQSILLFLITTPTYVLLLSSKVMGDGMGAWDDLFSRLMFMLVMVEFLADQQQWNFQGAKKRYQASAKVVPGHSREALDRGFITSGLWAWSRHPNFAAEQAVWVSLYQWCCCDTDTFMNWTFVGAISYLILFQASTWFTELISAKKYPEYRLYQKKVGKFLPKFGSKWIDFQDQGGLPEGKSPPSASNKANGKVKKR